MNKQYLYLPFLIALTFFASKSTALAYKFVEKDGEGTHVRAPFVHVDVGSPDQDGKRVRVKAPFVNVDNPPGSGNAQVNAPMTHVTRDAQSGTTNVKAPFTKVDKPTNGTEISTPVSTGTEYSNTSKGVNVNAPFARVQTNGANRNVHVKAPFTDVQR
ncbi:MAG: hypothetical protein C5B53_01155 [Candidatus Melainabacteria bacterium]|nr:MAG: hypothetical protein C5B53_01155 [Candidatus Melainabacteria bacterium]